MVETSRLTPDSAETDGLLVARARSGDREAFGALVARYQRPLMGRAFTRTRSVEDADDLVQETFFRAWQHLGSFRKDDSIGAWLFRTLDNLTADRGRRAGRETPGGEVIALTVEDPRPLAEQRLLDQELEERVHQALGSFPPGRRRDIFRMRFVEGCPIDVIASRLGLHSGTVKVHLFRGVRELRRRLEVPEGRP